ncbi:MAG: magnesium transporter [Ignavibacteria bacterium GWA2_35_9]|nr:MAG: magnesium transporter [Ignavibacteria bacterium GWA2_35_9]OGU51232.1 MAG: magnesium transporter [Ignavibacteria bacterium GWC2_36_12]
MLSRLLQPEIRSLLDARDFSTLKEVLSEWSPTDVAELISEFAESEQALIFRILPRDLAADIFEYIDFDLQVSLLKGLGKEEVAAILNEMSPDDRTALLEDLPGSAARQMITLLSAEERKIAVTLLGYPEESVGRLMTPDYIAVKPEWSINEVLNHIRQYGKDSETLNIIYVVDEKGKLVDDVRIRDIILASPGTKVSDLMDENFVALHVTDDQEKAVGVFKKYDRVALPVIDKMGLLIGIVTVDDVFDVAEAEATEDIHKIGGVEALDEPYSTIPILNMVKKRAVWLTILFIGEVLTAIAMGYFENEINKAIVLSVFIPLIISSGGNSGSQAATLVIRAMAIGEITLKDWWLIMRREILSGFSLGCILGTIGFLQVTILANFIGTIGEHWVLVGLTVGFSLIGIVLWGTFSGSMLPFILKRLGADPATSSAPLVATMVDVTGLVIYFTMAIIILSGTLL